jgi:3-isopropylmalate/(R)-2-methylmalate dehydratase small subunit
LLPVELAIEHVRAIAEQVTAAGGHAKTTVDLEAQTVTAPDGQVFAFRTPPLLRQMMLEGLDEIELTLSRGDEIAAFRDRDGRKRPWATGSADRALAGGGPGGETSALTDWIQYAKSTSTTER